MHFHATVHAGIGQDRGYLRARGLIESHVRHQPASKKGRNAILRAVHELVRHQKLARTQVFLQRTHCAHRNDALDSQLLHRANVRAKIDLAGQNTMSAPVPRQKRHALSFQRAHYNRVGRLSKRRLHPNLSHVVQPCHGVQPAASDDSDRRQRLAACRLLRLGLHHLCPQTIPLKPLSPARILSASSIRQPTLRQNLAHRRKRILLSSRHFLRQLGQPFFPARASKRPLQQPRLQQLDQP